MNKSKFAFLELKFSVFVFWILVQPIDILHGEPNYYCQELVGDTYDPVFSKSLAALGETNSKLFRFLTGRLSQRFLASTEFGFKELRELIGDCSDQKCGINLNGDRFYFKGSVQFINKNDKKILIIYVDVFKVKQLSEGGNTVEDVRFKKRPNSLNAAFVNFIGALFSGINDAVRANKEISRVQIYGTNIINKALVEIVESYGFKKTKQSLFVQYGINIVMFSMKTLFSVSPVKTIFSGGPFDASFITAKLMKDEYKAIHYLINRTLGNNWILEIPIIEE
ncbi:MAG: hypothetical protein QE271_04025 [Bacteriovoracaceae bacterium]|nr:hypothetical protein [Bacteriovoracaceae bacterium]